jgi:hypothetical protein
MQHPLYVPHSRSSSSISSKLVVVAVLLFVGTGGVLVVADVGEGERSGGGGIMQR